MRANFAKGGGDKRFFGIIIGRRRQFGRCRGRARGRAVVGERESVNGCRFEQVVPPPLPPSLRSAVERKEKGRDPNELEILLPLGRSSPSMLLSLSLSLSSLQQPLPLSSLLSLPPCGAALRTHLRSRSAIRMAAVAASAVRVTVSPSSPPADRRCCRRRRRRLCSLTANFRSERGSQFLCPFLRSFIVGTKERGREGGREARTLLHWAATERRPVTSRFLNNSCRRRRPCGHNGGNANERRKKGRGELAEKRARETK